VPVQDSPQFFVHNNFVLDLGIFILLLLLSIPVIHRFLRTDPDARWMARLLWISVVLHLFGSMAQDFVVVHIYHNSADYVGYDTQGAYLRYLILHGGFSFHGLEIPGDGMVGLTLAALYLVISPDALGSYFVFSWFAFLGLLAFFRAFCIVLPNADRRRYALLIFLMPSLVYWPSASGKEAIMLGALGFASYGAALLFTNQRRGWIYTAIGVGFGTLYRPHESLLLFLSLCVALALRRSKSGQSFPVLRWVVTITVLAGGALALSTVAASFLHLSSLSVSSVTKTLQTVNTNTVGNSQAAGFGSSVDYSWSPSLLDYPKDIYIVMFQPLPWQAGGFTQTVSALENVLIFGVVIWSWRRIVALPRTIFREPYVMMAVVYTIGFIYVFSALGNLGLLAREKVLVMPLLFVLFCVPGRNKARQRSFSDTLRATDPGSPQLLATASRG
jgi:hypothetical protein